jgi:16S rRNA (adenine(1408)-N(1))-methyltransferase
VLAKQAPERLFVGVDADAGGLRELSGRAVRARLENVLFVRAAVEALPPELAGVADRLTIILPWGSLLAAVARPVVSALRGIRGLCQPGAALEVVLALDAARDASEAARLDLPALDAAHLRGALTSGYAEAGFAVTSVRALGLEDLARWPSTWARRLAHGRPRPVVKIEARASRD